MQQTFLLQEWSNSETLPREAKSPSLEASWSQPENILSSLLTLLWTRSLDERSHVSFHFVGCEWGEYLESHWMGHSLPSRGWWRNGVGPWPRGAIQDYLLCTSYRRCFFINHFIANLGNDTWKESNKRRSRRKRRKQWGKSDLEVEILHHSWI